MIYFLILVPLGWMLFSLVAGFAVYRSSMTVHTRATRMMDSEKKTILNSHTKDPLIMEPLKAAKERWLLERESGSVTDLSVKTREGFSLSGFFRASAAVNATGKTAILVHGLMDSAAGMAYLAESYRGMGWNVLSVDQRAHGASGGTTRTMGVREGEDLGLWIRLLVSNYTCGEIYLHGVSMGAVSVLMYAAHTRNLPKEVRGLIVDSCFSSYRAVLFRLLKNVLGTGFLASSIVAGTDVACFLCTGIGFYRMDAARAVKNVSLPMLFFHGEKDRLLPLASMEKLFCAAKKQNAEIVVVHDAPHIGAWFYGPEPYMSKIREFSGRRQ